MLQAFCELATFLRYSIHAQNGDFDQLCAKQLLIGLPQKVIHLQLLKCCTYRLIYFLWAEAEFAQRQTRVLHIIDENGSDPNK